MPQYIRGEGLFERPVQVAKPLFKDARHMVHYLSRTNDDDDIWKKSFLPLVRGWKDERVTPPMKFQTRALNKILTKHPFHLAKDVLSQARHKRRGEQVGGGIGEAIMFGFTEIANVLGINKLREAVGLGYKHKEIPVDKQDAARAVKATYYSVKERPLEVGSLKRLPEYDTSRFSVWQEPNGQLLLTIHGTKLDAGDIFKDAGIASGLAKPTDSAVNAIIDKLVASGKPFDIAAHSLATQFVVNHLTGDEDNISEVLLFNPASSALQNTSYLREEANNKKYTMFVNPGDLVSNGLWQQMNSETVNNSYIAPYYYSPLASHSIGQWYQGDEPEKVKQEPEEPEGEKEEI